MVPWNSVGRVCIFMLSAHALMLWKFSMLLKDAL